MSKDDYTNLLMNTKGVFIGPDCFIKLVKAKNTKKLLIVSKKGTVEILRHNNPDINNQIDPDLLEILRATGDIE